MKAALVASLAALSSAAAVGFYDLSAVDIDGKDAPLSEYAGNVSLVVNTATY